MDNWCKFFQSAQNHNQNYKSAILLSAATLTENSSAHDRYEKFCEYHNTSLAKLSLNGDEFRVALNSTSSFVENVNFFWSESDRFAGYRKIQILSSLISNLDYSLEELNNDENLLFETFKILYNEDLEIRKECSIARNFLKNFKRNIR